MLGLYLVILMFTVQFGRVDSIDKIDVYAGRSGLFKLSIACLECLIRQQCLDENGMNICAHR